MSGAVSHKERTRQRILDEAAAIMRVVGTEGIGVAALMKRVGLTHGGFYAHFSSRDDLVAQVVGQMFDQTHARARSEISDGSVAQQLAQLIDLYLSPEARNAPECSCPLPSLSGEASRLPPEARQRFDQGIQAMHALLVQWLSALGHEETRMLASSVQAEMIGAMALARAIPDEARAGSALQASRTALKQRIGI